MEIMGFVQMIESVLIALGLKDSLQLLMFRGKTGRPNSDENQILGEREFDVTFGSGSFSSFLAVVSGDLLVFEILRSEKKSVLFLE